MFGSDILEVCIGIVFVFVLVSTICSAVREAIEALLKTRGSYLEFGIRQLLHDAKGDGLAKDFFSHPLISSLFAGEYVPGPEGERRRLWHRGRNLPSYVPSRNFAIALMDLVCRARAAPGSDSTVTPLSLQEIRASAGTIANPALQRALLVAIDSAQGNLDRARENIEAWYDSAMDRVSGWYKRSTQWIIFWIALTISVGANIDTLAIADHLFRHAAVREAIVTAVEQTAASPADRGYQDAMQRLEELHLPIGWASTSATTTAPPSLWNDIVGPVIGWLMTAFAATLGAPFWFDLLNKIMVIRSTVKPREKSQEEGSEDRKATPKIDASARQPVAAASVAPLDGVAPHVVAAETLAVDELDPCSVGATAATPDDRLPAAEGGVA